LTRHDCQPSASFPGHLDRRLQDRLVSAQDTAADQLSQQAAADTTHATVLKDECSAHDETQPLERRDREAASCQGELAPAD
jgi:hypothetical protein